jgi:branched-chain amino acid transport system permease protein
LLEQALRITTGSPQQRLVIRRFYAVPIVAVQEAYAIGLIMREGVRSLIGGLYISVP